MMYNAIVELDGARTPESADVIVDHLSEFDTAVAVSTSGNMILMIALDAPSVAAATRSALGLALDFQLGGLRRLEVLSQEDYRRRVGVADLEDGLNVREAAAELGVSTQAVRQRLKAGTLTGRKDGRTWHVSRAAVAAAKARQQAGARIRRIRSIPAGGGTA